MGNFACAAFVRLGPTIVFRKGFVMCSDQKLIGLGGDKSQEKLRLEHEKFKLELRALQRPFYKRASFWVALMAIFSAFSGGSYKYYLSTLKTQKAQLDLAQASQELIYADEKKKSYERQIKDHESTIKAFETIIENVRRDAKEAAKEKNKLLKELKLKLEETNDKLLIAFNQLASVSKDVEEATKLKAKYEREKQISHKELSAIEAKVDKAIKRADWVVAGRLFVEQIKEEHRFIVMTLTKRQCEALGFVLEQDGEYYEHAYIGLAALGTGLVSQDTEVSRKRLLEILDIAGQIWAGQNLGNRVRDKSRKEALKELAEKILEILKSTRKLLDNDISLLREEFLRDKQLHIRDRSPRDWPKLRPLYKDLL